MFPADVAAWNRIMGVPSTGRQALHNSYRPATKDRCCGTNRSTPPATSASACSRAALRARRHLRLNLTHFVAKSERPPLDPVRTEGVGLQHVFYFPRSGCQFRITVIGDALASSARVFIKNRCPSGDTTYCCLLVYCTAPPTRVPKSGTGAPARTDRPSGANWIGTAMSRPSNAM